MFEWNGFLKIQQVLVPLRCSWPAAISVHLPLCVSMRSYSPSKSPKFPVEGFSLTGWVWAIGRCLRGEGSLLVKGSSQRSLLPPRNLFVIYAEFRP